MIGLLPMTLPARREGFGRYKPERPAKGLFFLLKRACDAGCSWRAVLVGALNRAFMYSYIRNIGQGLRNPSRA